MKPLIYVNLVDGKVVQHQINHPTEPPQWSGVWDTYIHAAAAEKVGEDNERLAGELKSVRADNARLLETNRVLQADVYALGRQAMPLAYRTPSTISVS